MLEEAPKRAKDSPSGKVVGGGLARASERGAGCPEGACLSGKQESKASRNKERKKSPSPEAVEGPAIGLVLILNMKKTKLCVKK